MRLRGAALLVGLVVLGAVPASAAPAPQVSDACGDATTRAEWNGEGTDVEENRAYLDLRNGGVGGLYEGSALTGFVATVEVCGDVSAAEGGYTMFWGYGDNCTGAVSWTLGARHTPGGTGLQGSVQRTVNAQGVVRETCYHEPESPLEPSSETVFEVALPEESLVFEGSTLTFTVPRSLLPEAGRKRLAAGTEWTNVGALAMDQAASAWVGYLDTEGNEGEVMVRADFMLGETSYVVGEDRPG